MIARGPVGRRHLLAVSGAVVCGLAGCTDDAGLDGTSQYEDGEIDAANAEPRGADEMAAAERLAEDELHEGVTPLEELEITDHKFVAEDDVRGPTVQGVVENTGSDRIEVAEVRVRVYDDEAAHLGRYLDSTGELDGGGEWAFEVVLLESPEDLSSYDIAVLGTPT